MKHRICCFRDGRAKGNMLAPEPRAALVFTGHLRATCAESKGIERGILNHSRWCLEKFDGRCDVFLHSEPRTSILATLACR